MARGPILLDFIRQSVWVDGREVDLQPLQVRLLGCLMRKAGHAVAYDELRAQVFRASQARDSTGLARQVSVLRRRLGSAGALIVTQRRGYSLALPNPSAAVNAGGQLAPTESRAASRAAP